MSENRYDFSRLTEALIAHWGEWIKEVAEVILPAIEIVMEAVYEDYVEQGAIYGDTTDGMLRWLRELSERDKYLMRAAYITQRQKMLREFKEKLDERRRSAVR